MRKRILIDIAVLIGALVLPWWLAILFATAFVFLYERYYEIIVIGLIIDSLYSVPAPAFFNFQFTATLICIGIFAFLFIFKRQLRVYGV